MIEKIRSKPKALFRRMQPHSVNWTFTSTYFDAWIQGNAPWYYDALHKKYPQDFRKINLCHHIIMALDDDYFNPKGQVAEEEKLTTAYQVIEEFLDDILDYYHEHPLDIDAAYTSGDILRELVFRGFTMIGYTDLQVKEHHFLRSQGLAYAVVYPKNCANAKRAALLLKKVGIPGKTTVNVPTAWSKPIL